LNAPIPKAKKKQHTNRRIEGLGEDAYWELRSGALYVLQGDKFIRVSVGGVGEESARIEKSKILALAAVKRL
jgi:hypothetical protein